MDSIKILTEQEQLLDEIRAWRDEFSRNTQEIVQAMPTIRQHFAQIRQQLLEALSIADVPSIYIWQGALQFLAMFEESLAKYADRDTEEMDLEEHEEAPALTGAPPSMNNPDEVW